MALKFGRLAPRNVTPAIREADSGFATLCLFLYFALFPAWVSNGQAQEIEGKAVQGSLFIAGSTPIDPPRNERKNTHAYITLDGPGALAIYKSMRARERDDACRGDGWKLKSARHFVCSISKDRKTAECDFAVNLRNGRLAPGKPC